MENIYNQGNGLIDLNATSISSDYITCDNYQSYSGIENHNLSTLSNIENLYIRKNIGTSNISACNINQLSNSFIILSNFHNTLSNSFVNLSNNHNTLSNSHSSLSNSFIILNNNHNILSNTYISYSNTFLKVFNSNLYTFSNITLGTSNAVQQLTLTGSIQCSNVNFSNLIRYRGQNVFDTDGKIDYSWLKNTPPNDGSSITVIPVPIITTIYTTIKPTIETDLGGDAIDDAFDDNTISVHWNSLIFKPIYQNINNLDIGFGSNVYFSTTGNLYTINKTELIDNTNGMFRRISYPTMTSNLLYNTSTRDLYITQLNTSNIISSNVNTSNLSVSNASINILNIRSNINLNSNFLYITNSNTYLAYKSNATYIGTEFSTFNNASFGFTSNNIYSNVFSYNSNGINTSNIISLFGDYSNLNIKHIIVSSNALLSNIFTSNIDSRISTSINSTISNNLISLCNSYHSNVFVSNLSINTIDNLYPLEVNAISRFNNVIYTNDRITPCVISMYRGTTPSSNDTNYFGFGLSNNSIRYQVPNNTTDHIFFQNNVELMRIKGNGFVGINNINPTHRLDVNGYIKSLGGFIGDLTSSNGLLFSNNKILDKDSLIDIDLLSNINSNLGIHSTSTDTYQPDKTKSIYTHFNNIAYPSFYTDEFYNFGFSSNVFFNSNSKLCSITPSWDYTKSNAGFKKTYNYPFTSSNVVIDFTTHSIYLSNAYLSNVLSCNISVSNLTSHNISVSNISTSNISTSNLTACNIFTKTIGINQVNPLYALDVNGNCRIQNDVLVNLNLITSNVSSSNSYLSNLLTNQIIINGDTTLTNGNINTGWTNNQALFGFNRTSTYRHAINTRHNAFGGNQNSIDFLLWNNNKTLNEIGNCNSLSITATGIGIFTSNPSFSLDVNGNCKVLTDITCSNITTSNASLSNLISNRITTNRLNIPGNNVIEMGQGVTKESSAGIIGYETFTSAHLDIVGAGTSGNPRKVKIWDHLNINSSFSVGPSGDAIYNMQFFALTNITNGTRSFDTTITDNLNSTNKHCFTSFRDTAVTRTNDSFVAKTVDITANQMTIRIIRVDANSGWTQPIDIIFFVYQV